MQGPESARVGAAVLAAALALPGMIPRAAAESAPTEGLIGLRYLNYQDSQPGLKRVTVNAPSLSWVVPLAGEWAIAGSAVIDSVSGASPRWHSAISSASHMADTRRAGDLRVTRYFSRSSLSFGTAFSSEHDYRSASYSLVGTVSSDDNNTTWSFGVGSASDTINPVNNVVVNERRRTLDLMVGVTRVLTPTDIVQATATWAGGSGDYSDPYKMIDNRPRTRDQLALMLRWNHHFAAQDATLRTSWRIYHDSFGVNAHTLAAEWVQTLPGGWTLTPLARYHDQGAASFYYDTNYDPLLGAPFPNGYLSNPTGLYASDQRLSAFGALTLGLKVSKIITRQWTADARLEFYEQRGGWRLLGNGSTGLAPFRARFMQVGVQRKF